MLECIPKVITFLRPILSCGTCTNFRFKKCTVKYSVFSVVYVHSASAYLINRQDLSVEKIKWGQKAINGEYFLYCFSFGRPPTPSKKESVYNGLSRSWCLVTLADLYLDFWKVEQREYLRSNTRYWMREYRENASLSGIQTSQAPFSGSSII